MKVIETPRLMLRRLEPGDARFILRLVNEPSWIKNIGDKGVKTLKEAESYITDGPMEMYRRRGYGLLLIESKEHGVPIGLCGVLKRDALPHADLGFALLPEFWGQGYAHEAAAASVAHARTSLGLKRLLAITSQDNDRSGRLLEKVGFAFEGMVRLTPQGEELKLYGSQ